MEILAYLGGTIVFSYAILAMLVGQTTIIMWIDDYFNNKKNRRK